MESTSKSIEPTAIVIFGGTGDLAQTKLLPALLDLYIDKLLPEVFTVIGLSRKKMTNEQYQAFAREGFTAKGHDHSMETINAFCAHLQYVSGSFDDATSYSLVKETLLQFDRTVEQCTNKLFYLAVPPQFYQTIFEKINISGVMELCGESWSRLLVEKPFGRDLTTAQVLEKQLCSLFAEEKIYRIDHYLAKDAIENITALRFANNIIADSWNKEQIESICIRLFETKNVSNRGSFYDRIGTLRDVGQNHILQILALLTMTNVDINAASSVRQARAEALKDLRNHILTKVTRGQYEGYVDTDGVDDVSQTETYFKIESEAEGGQWDGVKFVMEAGKALATSVNEAIVTFRSHNDCNCSYSENIHNHNNVLRVEFSPAQSIRLTMWMKKPGFKFSLEEKELVLLKDKAENTHSPEAYERVLHDCIRGDQTRFVSGVEVEAAWQFITPILEQFKTLKLNIYQPGSNGPESA